MILDAVLAYLHFMAMFLLFAFLTAQAILLRGPLDGAAVRLLGRTDIWYFGSAAAVLLTGFLRAGLGAKGADFYFGAWPIYAKIGLFLAVGIISVTPTLAYIRWRRGFEHQPGFAVPADEHRRMRRLVMIEVHLGALIPVVAVMMARGIGH